uniref:Uncharacterized protein n=1 Tax=Sinocyclocheilus anshuiensis TaxID=1608454 RepID=A0A671P9B4_9TELE
LSESDPIVVPSVLDFVSQDEMLTPLGRLDKYISSENVFNRLADDSESRVMKTLCLRSDSCEL